MTVTLTPGYIPYTGDGFETVFPIPFEFLGDVTAIDVYDVTGGFDPAQLFVQGTDYTITGIPGNPAVTFIVPPTLGQMILINRWMDPTQEVVYPITGVFPAKATGQALDKLTILIQQLLDGIINGTLDLATFMKLVAGTWRGLGHEIVNLLPGTAGDSAATVAQVVAIFEGGVPAVISGNSYWTFLGDGVTTDFELPGSFGHDANDFQVYIGIAHQTSGGAAPSYTVVPGAAAGEPDILVFSTPPPNGDQIEVYIPSGSAVLSSGNIVLDGNNVADGSLPVDKLAPGPDGHFAKTVGSVVDWVVVHTNDIPSLSAFLIAFPVSSMGAAVAPLNMGGQRIVNGQAGINPTDVAIVAQLQPGKRTKTGIVAWTGTAPNWTSTIDFPFVVGQFTFVVSGTISASGFSDSRSVAFHSNTTYVVSPAGGLSISVARTSIPGGTRITLTTNVGTGTLTAFANNAFFGAEGDA